MSRMGWGVLISAWFVCACCGFWVALDYQRTAAATDSAPLHWPGSCDLSTDPALPTMLVFVHPKCPCTRATLAELERLLSRRSHRATVLAIFLRPEGVSAGWEKTDLWAKANAIPGVRGVVDQDGQYRRLFHASASGECFLYDANGTLVFHGGMTSGRGHEGDSLGKDSLACLLSDIAAPTNQTPVYGCLLKQPNQNSEQLP